MQLSPFLGHVGLKMRCGDVQFWHTIEAVENCCAFEVGGAIIHCYCKDG